MLPLKLFSSVMSSFNAISIIQTNQKNKLKHDSICVDSEPYMCIIKP